MELIFTKKIVIGGTPLFVTCENGHMDIIKYLVEYGANINKKKKKKRMEIIL